MKKLIVANWKMNPQTLDEARKIFSSIEHRMHLVSDNTEVAICAPFVFIPALKHYSHYVGLGAQNVSWMESGALTGEVSAQQLKQMNVKYVVLGHSERRIYMGETDSVVNAKIVAALKHKITPVLCLGGEEGAQQQEMKALVTRQFVHCTKDLEKKDLEKIVYVYEPVWAISTMKKSKPATGEHAYEMIVHIYELLEHRLGRGRVGGIKILYGGTVNKDNVHEYASYPQIDGALVGAASLDADNFWHIISEFSRESVHKL